MIRSLRGTLRAAPALLVSLLTAVLVLAGLVVATQASATTLASGATTRHPFSDPVWYPLRGSSGTMDCATYNPGCVSSKHHPDDAMTILSRTMKGNDPTYHVEAVYAAGAGILHIGANIGNSCTSVSGIGTWVWIDHGGGVASRYGHLRGILPSIHNGEYVTPTTIIGYTGHSGELASGDCNHATNYLNFQIEHNFKIVDNHISDGTPVLPGNMKVCQGSKAVWWPSAIKSSYTTWQHVPDRTVLDNLHQSATSCVGSPWWKTSTTPWTRLKNQSGSITPGWENPAPSYKVHYVQVLVQLYHPTTGNWDQIVRTNVTVGRGHHNWLWVRNLMHGREYRVETSFWNSSGWSAPSTRTVVVH